MTDAHPAPACPDADNATCMMCCGPARYVHPLMVCDNCGEWWPREFDYPPEPEPPVNDARLYERTLL